MKENASISDELASAFADVHLTTLQNQYQQNVKQNFEIYFNLT